MTGTEEVDREDDAIRSGIVDDEDPVGVGPAYTRSEWRGVLTPAIVLLVVVALVVIAWYLVRDTGPDEQRMDDVDVNGSFNLIGYWMQNLTAYGSHVHAINLTFEEGDILALTYSSHGPPGGIQVRLQHPLHPTDGSDGTGGTKVYASSIGGNGTIDLIIDEGGAYQLYFWHPGSNRSPGEGDDPDDHTTAAVGYHLVVTRAHRP